MKIVAEKDQAYLVKGSKVVAAFDIEDIETPVVPKDFEIGTRVAYGEKLGTVATRENSMYGPFYGVKFDDGTLAGLEANDLTTSIVPSPNFDAPIDEIKSEWEEYRTIPSDTVDQIETKSSIARSLNLRARALKTDRQTAFSDSIVLDKIATATEVDLLDLKTAKEVLSNNNPDADYLAGLPKKVDFRTIKGNADEDTSWLGEFEVEDNADWDTDLTNIAISMASKFDKEQLGDKDFMKTAVDYQADYLGLDDDKRSYLERAINETSKEKLEAPVATKTASVEEKPLDLENYDSTELFI